MTTTIPSSRIPFPDWTLADALPSGGWAKRATVPASKMPHLHGDQSPCPTNGHLSRGRFGLTCTHHRLGWHVSASLGRVLAVWPDKASTARDRADRTQADHGSA